MGYFYNFEKLKYLKEKRGDGCILCLIEEGSDAVIDLTLYKDPFFIQCLQHR